MAIIRLFIAILYHLLSSIVGGYSRIQIHHSAMFRSQVFFRDFLEK
jgi:hypothetical protein